MQIGGWVELGIVRVGVTIRATVMDTKVIPQAVLGLVNGGGIRGCLDLSMSMVPFKISIDFVVELFICLKFCTVCMNLGFCEICVPLPCGFIWCPPITYNIYEWSMAPMVIDIFTVCSVAPDSTPPKIDRAFAHVQQQDGETVRARTRARRVFACCV